MSPYGLDRLVHQEVKVIKPTQILTLPSMYGSHQAQQTFMDMNSKKEKIKKNHEADSDLLILRKNNNIKESETAAIVHSRIANKDQNIDSLRGS
jgi:hypothetical protein